MKPPSWLSQAKSMRADGQSYAEIANTLGVSPASAWRALNPNGRTHEPQPLLAAAKRKQWADPEWAKRQRGRIIAGMYESEKDIGRQHGAERQAPYDPLNNPRMQRILGGKR